MWPMVYRLVIRPLYRLTGWSKWTETEKRKRAEQHRIGHAGRRARGQKYAEEYAARPDAQVSDGL